MEQKELHIKEPFKFEHGDELPEVRIRYNTYGKLNEAKNNVIWVVHALTANSEIHDWWNGLFGPENILDPEKYFIICANNLGSPYGTTCPNHINPLTGERYGMNFPEFTVRDTANLHLKLKDHLQISSINYLIGGSCGGNIALEMAISEQRRIQNLILLCCSAKEQPWTIAIHHAQRIAMDGDADFHQNKSFAGKRGLKASRATALPFYRTAQSMNYRQKESDLNKTNNFKSASYINYQGEKFIQRFDAHCYYKLLNALDTHNVGRYQSSIENALAQIKAKTLVLGIDTDLFIPKEEQKFLAENIPNANYAEINSIYGHDAFLIETDQIRSLIQQFKDD